MMQLRRRRQCRCSGKLMTELKAGEIRNEDAMSQAFLKLGYKVLRLAVRQGGERIHQRSHEGKYRQNVRRAHE